MVESALAVPCKLDTPAYSVTVDTEYPFRNRTVYTVKAAEAFTLGIRIPSFAKALTVDGKAAEGDQTFAIASGETRVITVEFETEVEWMPRPYELYAVKQGSLLFALPIPYETRMREYERNGVERKFPYCDYEYLPKGEWNFGYTDVSKEASFKGISVIPFSSKEPPVTLKATVTPIEWGFEDGYDTVCAKVPASRTPAGEAREIELYPYGCAKLRMTELPIVK